MIMNQFNLLGANQSDRCTGEATARQCPKGFCRWWPRTIALSLSSDWFVPSFDILLWSYFTTCDFGRLLVCMFLTNLSENRLNEGSMRAECSVVGPVLTAQHHTAWLAFTREHHNWLHPAWPFWGESVMVWGRISLEVRNSPHCALF